MTLRIPRHTITLWAGVLAAALLTCPAAPAGAAPGFGYGDPRSHPLSNPVDVLAEPDGFLLLESGRHGIVSRVDPGSDSFVTLAGSDKGKRLSEEPQAADSVRIVYPYDIARDGDDVLVTEPGYGKVARISGGSIRVIYEKWGQQPNSLAVLPGGDFLFGDFIGQIIRVAPDGSSSRAAGTGDFGLSPDGSKQPGSPIMYPDGGIAPTTGGGYVYAEGAADYSAVRRVAPDGTVTTLAGGHGIGYSGDGGPATAAKLDEIRDLDVTADGNVLIAAGDRVREIVPGGEINTVAGTGGRLYDDDGVPAVRANLGDLQAVSATPDGGFLLTAEGRVRKVGPDGIIHTVAGMPARDGCDAARYNGIQGGSGNDRLAGSRLDDLIRGELHADELLGRAGRDCLLSGLGNDRVSGGAGADTIFSDNGRDHVDGDRGGDTINGEGADDVLIGGRGRDMLVGERGDDLLRGGRGRDRLYGDSGRDVLIGGRGRDVINSGAYDPNASNGPADVVRCGPGKDTVIADRSDRIARNCEKVTYD